MGIKYGSHDLVKRIIDWHEVEKVMYNGSQIWPNTAPTPQPTYHIMWDFTQGVMPSWRQTTDWSIDQDWFSWWHVFYSDFGEYKFTNLGKAVMDLDFYVEWATYGLQLGITFWDATDYPQRNYLSFRDLPEEWDYHLHLEITDINARDYVNPFILTWPNWYHSEGTRRVTAPNKDNITIWVYNYTYLKNVTIDVYKYPVFSVSPAIASGYVAPGQTFYLDVLDMWASGVISAEDFPITFLNITHPTDTTTRVLCVVGWENNRLEEWRIKASTWEYETNYRLLYAGYGYTPASFDNSACWTLWEWITLSWESISCTTYRGDSFADIRFAENLTVAWMVSFYLQNVPLVDGQDIATVELYNNETLVKTVDFRLVRNLSGRDISQSINWWEWEETYRSSEAEFSSNNIGGRVNRIRVYPRPWISITSWGQYDMFFRFKA